MDNELQSQLQLNENNLNHQYKSSSISYSTINIPKPPINNQRQHQYSWSFNEHFTSSKNQDNIHHINTTPVCSDNDEESEYDNDDDIEYQPSVTPGAKRWYMSFPDDTPSISPPITNNKYISITKSAPTINHINNINNNINNNIHNNDSLSSFELGMGMDFDYENLQHQETDIFASKNLSKTSITHINEGGFKYNNDSMINDGNKPGITMMGYTQNSSSSIGFRLNENSIYIPGGFQSNIYSEGNIKYNSDDDVIHNEGDGINTEITMNMISSIKQNNYNDIDDDEDDGDNGNKGDLQGITLMGPIQTNDINMNGDGDDDDEDEDEDDDMFINHNNNNNNITLMGEYDVSHKIVFDMKSEHKYKENKEEKVGITLMGHFDDNQDEIPFIVQQKGNNNMV